MEITKIDSLDVAKAEEYLNIPVSEMRKLFQKIVASYETNLKQYGVKQLWKDDVDLFACTDSEFIENVDSKALQLIFLYKYIHCFVHKDTVSAFVRKYKPTAALDQQVRHLGTQLFWNVLNKGMKVPDRDEEVPSGYHYLVSIETPNPKVVAMTLKRIGRLAAKSFDELKLAYGGKCATCGIEEGRKDTRNGVSVSLQQGHMNPREPLTLANTIPQCQYCNQQYLDHFIFNEHGRVVAVNNPVILLKSPRDVQDEMITVLLEERKKR